MDPEVLWWGWLKCGELCLARWVGYPGGGCGVARNFRAGNVESYKMSSRFSLLDLKEFTSEVLKSVVGNVQKSKIPFQRR